MKHFTATILATALAIVGITVADTESQDEQREQRAQLTPAAFLQQLVGEWSVVVYAVQDPNEEPYRFEGKETARMLGRQWLVSEFISEVEGITLNSILTIGYDPAQKKFVATYVNAMQSQLWTYDGTLNDEQTTLTLKTEGPFMGNPAQKADYRVVIDRKNADEWTMSSKILVPDEGEWFEFLRFEYQRKE